jgi:hypothetical protein
MEREALAARRTGDPRPARSRPGPVARPRREATGNGWRWMGKRKRPGGVPGLGRTERLASGCRFESCRSSNGTIRALASSLCFLQRRHRCPRCSALLFRHRDPRCGERRTNHDQRRGRFRVECHARDEHPTSDAWDREYDGRSLAGLLAAGEGDGRGQRYFLRKGLYDGRGNGLLCGLLCGHFSVSCRLSTGTTLPGTALRVDHDVARGRFAHRITSGHPTEDQAPDGWAIRFNSRWGRHRE